MSNQIEQIPAEIEREMKEVAELAPCCDFCHYSDIMDREEWSLEKFRHFYAAGMRAERERLASCPAFKGWVARDKCGELYFFKERPTRGATMWNTEDFCAFMPFPQRNLPSLRWEDEPREVEIIIKEVKK